MPTLAHHGEDDEDSEALGEPVMPRAHVAVILKPADQALDLVMSPVRLPVEPPVPAKLPATLTPAGVTP